MNLKLTVTLILSSLVVVFIAQNTTVVEIAFLFWRMSMSSAILIFFTLMIGFLLGWVLHGHISGRKPAK